MRKIIYTLVCLLPIWLGSCIEDNGNYEYLDESDVLPVKITGLESSMTVMKGTTLSLTPEVEDVDDPSRYVYKWYIMEYTSAGTLPTRRDIQEGKDLNWAVSLEPGQWRLNFQVLDEKRNIYRRHEIVLTIVGCPLATGWYLLKEEEGGTELDYITRDGEMYPNALGEHVPGSPVAVAYQTQRYCHTITGDDGKVTTLNNLPALHVLTTQQMYTFSGKDMTLLKKYADLFYEQPAACNPQEIMWSGSSDLYMINAGKMYYIYGMSANIGKYSAPVTGFYDLYPAIMPYSYYNVLVFDKDSRSFYKISGMNSNLISVSDVTIDEEELSLTNMPYDVQNMGVTANSMSDGQSFLVMKHVEEGNYRLMRVAGSTYEGVFESFREIPEGSLLPECSMIAPSFGSDFLYFVNGQSVYSYKNAPGLAPEDKEQALLTYPADERIAIVRVVYATGSNAMNALVVVTNKAGKWKLYQYNLLGESTPEIETEPAVTYEGEGNAKYLMYRMR